MNTLIKSLFLGTMLAVGSAFAAPTVDLALDRSVNVADLRDANLDVGSEVASLRVGMGDFRLTVNGFDPDLASLTVGWKHGVVGFDHVNATVAHDSFGLGLSRDAQIAGALSLTSGVGLTTSDATEVPSVVANVGLVLSVW